MNEAEWLGQTDPGPMLDYLTGRPDRPDDRKLRLFACACVRRLQPYLTDRRCRAALEKSEAFADGLAARRELWVSHQSALSVLCGLIADCELTAIYAD